MRLFSIVLLFCVYILSLCSHKSIAISSFLFSKHTLTRNCRVKSDWLAVTRGGKVHKLNTLQGTEDIIRSASLESKLVILGFISSRCDSCQDITSKYEEFSTKFPHVIFTSLDIGKHTELSRKYNIKSVPTFLFLLGG